MIIAFCPVRKGTGQTTTIINIGMYSAVILKRKTLIIDLNDYSSDIEFYLSRAGCTGGLDEYAGLSGARSQNSDILKQCSEAVTENLDIMTANKCTEITREKLKRLLDFCKDHYDLILVDCKSVGTEASQAAIAEAEKICVVAFQNRRIVEQIKEMAVFKINKNKLVTIINRCWDKSVEKDRKNRPDYTPDMIRTSLNKAGILNIMVLPYDLQIFNMMNNDCIQGYIPSFHGTRKGYLSRLEEGLNEYLFNAAPEWNLRCMQNTEKKQPDHDFDKKDRNNKKGGVLKWKRGRLSVS